MTKQEKINEWLNQHGGRSIRDILSDADDKQYVTLQHGRDGEYAVYIPEFEADPDPEGIDGDKNVKKL